MDLETRFAQALVRLVPGGKLLAAVSGGGDSVAMLYLLKACKRQAVVAHMDHGLRADSAEDARWVQGLAAELGFEFVGLRVNAAEIAAQKKANLEATARELRYRFLTRSAKEHKAVAVLTAHTADDQAETVLMQLASGTVKAGGIRSKLGRVIRPLLEFGREELRDYLRQQGRGWLEDWTNQLTALDRNYVRLEVLPKLYQRFPKAVQAFGRFAEVRQQEEEWLEIEAQNRLLRDDRWPVPAFRIAPILQTPAGLRGRVLRQMLEAVRLRPNAEQLKRLEQALTAKPQSLSEGYLARRQAGSIFLIPDRPGLPFPQGLRTPRPGDYLPMPYGHKRLVEFFAERGMPPELRKLWPVGAEGSEVQAVWQWWPHEPEDLIWMRRAIRAAKSVAEGGEVPVAAVIVQAGRALSPVCANTSEDLADATAHAELKAIQASLSSAGQKVLPPGSTLYVTLEPCLMCYGAALEARVSRIVWATENTKAGFFTAHKVVPKMPVKGGVLEQEAARLLGDFFGKLRVKVRNPRPGVSGH